MGIVNIFLYLVLPLLTLAYYYVNKKYSYFKDRGIPHLKPSWIYGNLDGVAKEVHMVERISQVYNEFKEKDLVAGFFTLTTPSLIATDLELIKNITVKDFNNFTDRGVFVNEEDEPMTGHLFAIGGEKWRFLRNKLSPVFTSGKLKNMFETILKKGNNLAEAAEKKSKFGSVEMKKLANRYTVDLVSSTVFGLDANTLGDENPELTKVFSDIFGPDGVSVFYFFFLMAFPNFAKFMKMKQFPPKITDFFNDVIKSSISQREKSKEKRNDFLNMLIELKNKGSIDGEFSSDVRKLTLNEVVAQAFVFYFAGADTSSNAIAYATVELGLHPQIQEKLRAEILEKTKANKGEITYDNLHEMTYLSQVVNETLRKFPSAPFTIRESMDDYKIPNSKHVIQKGTQVMIPNISIQNDPRYWKNPEKFDPDRFTAEEIAKRPNLAYMPFGEGPRNCIGMRFALVNVKFAIASLVKNFKLTTDTSKVKLPLKFDPKEANITPQGGFYVNLVKV